MRDGLDTEVGGWSGLFLNFFLNFPKRCYQLFPDRSGVGRESFFGLTVPRDPLGYYGPLVKHYPGYISVIKS